jgi:hypothetical protein
MKFITPLPFTSTCQPPAEGWRALRGPSGDARGAARPRRAHLPRAGPRAGPEPLTATLASPGDHAPGTRIPPPHTPAPSGGTGGVRAGGDGGCVGRGGAGRRHISDRRVRNAGASVPAVHGAKAYHANAPHPLINPPDPAIAHTATAPSLTLPLVTRICCLMRCLPAQPGPGRICFTSRPPSPSMPRPAAQRDRPGRGFAVRFAFQVVSCLKTLNALGPDSAVALVGGRLPRRLCPTTCQRNCMSQAGAAGGSANCAAPSLHRGRRYQRSAFPGALHRAGFARQNPRRFLGVVHDGGGRPPAAAALRRPPPTPIAGLHPGFELHPEE